MYRQCILGNYNLVIEGVNESERSFLEKFKPFINHQNISEINSLMNEAYYHLERNANPTEAVGIAGELNTKKINLLKKIGMNIGEISQISDDFEIVRPKTLSPRNSNF